MEEQHLENKIISLCEPKIQGREWQYLKECLDTNWVSSAGRFVDQFESTLADYLERKHGVACINGTAALHIALLVAGIKPNDEVIMPALTFVAPANAVSYVGAFPVFVDVQPDIWQMDPQKIKDFISKECQYTQGCLINRHTKRKIRAILPVHLLGHPVDMDPILDLAKQFDLVVIEDAAESLGSTYKGRKSGTLGDIGCFSFNGNKIITAGGGGMLVTDDPQWADKARYFITQAKTNVLENIHEDIGYNYRLTNIQAAMGVAQMECLDEYIAIKRRMARRYDESFKGFEGITLPVEAPWAQSIFWLYTICVHASEFGMDSRQLLDVLKEAGIQSRPLWHPLHQLKPFEQCYAYHIETASSLYQNCLSLPSSVGLVAEDQDKVIQLIRESNRKVNV